MPHGRMKVECTVRLRCPSWSITEKQEMEANKECEEVEERVGEVQSLGWMMNDSIYLEHRQLEKSRTAKLFRAESR